MVLSACSPYFKALLEENPAKHPIIILKDVPFQHLTAILEFMYAGEVNVAQDQLPAFLKTAKDSKSKDWQKPLKLSNKNKKNLLLPSQHRTIFQTLYSILSCLHTLKKLEKKKNNLKESQCVLNMSRSQLNISTHAFENKKKPLNHVKVKIE